MTTTEARSAPGKPDAPRPRAAIKARTLRTDRWWIAPLVSGGGFAFLLIYTGIRVFFLQHDYYVAKYNYLTPIFSPCISNKCPAEAADFGRFMPEGLPWFIPLPIITLGILTVFRLTCYYYRKLYYRSYFFSPAGCAVNEFAKKYSGETKFPLILQNIHRYGWYGAVVLMCVNIFDATKSFHGADGGFGIGLGTLIMWINVIMIAGYTVSCHACRHTVGGKLKHFSKHPVRYQFWQWVSKANAKHMAFAWASLISVIVTDIYIMLVANGTITDFRFFN